MKSVLKWSYEMSPKDYFLKAVDQVGGQTEMARRLGVIQPRVWNWINRDKKVPAEYVMKIVSIDEVSIKAHQLRPDVFPAEMTAA